MKRSVVYRALFADALAQVLDNRVFRILAWICGLMVGFTFAVGFREDSIWLFGGWREYFYEDVFDFFGLGGPSIGTTQQQEAIRIVQDLFAKFVAGSVGILFGIASTVFFVPRLLEKGFADGFFSKPVSRFALLLSRYFASILFVSLLASFLVGGMHLGFLLASGYSDPSFLWTAATLVYLFALISSFAVLFGTLTRSTVAALLLTFASYGATTGVHNLWVLYDYGRSEGHIRRLYEQRERAAAEGQSSPVADAFVDTAITTLETLHNLLPRTHDAKYLIANLRDQVAELPPEDERRPGDDGLPWLTYQSRLGWNTPWQYNFAWSISASLLFVAAALALSWWRLSRISF
jgi:ABC-type transport system involved in multi-copper enzyme maturation permease subunit